MAIILKAGVLFGHLENFHQFYSAEYKLYNSYPHTV